MKILDKKIPRYFLVIIVIFGLLTGVSVGALVSPIWSNVSQSTINSQPWTGTVVLANNATTGQTGDYITLTATLNPLPTQYQLQQNVTFWYSATPITLSNSGTPINPNQLTNLPASNTNSGVTTVAGIAHLTFQTNTNGTFYFIAEVQNPT